MGVIHRRALFRSRGDDTVVHYKEGKIHLIPGHLVSVIAEICFQILSCNAEVLHFIGGGTSVYR